MISPCSLDHGSPMWHLVALKGYKCSLRAYSKNSPPVMRHCDSPGKLEKRSFHNVNTGRYFESSVAN